MISTCPDQQHHQDGSGSIRLVVGWLVGWLIAEPCKNRNTWYLSPIVQNAT
jgi:hypothetical protein